MLSTIGSVPWVTTGQARADRRGKPGGEGGAADVGVAESGG